MILPDDIARKVNQLFSDPAENGEVKEMLLRLWSMPLNVGPEQLARSILFLSDGNVATIKSIFEKDFYGDPRDVLGKAEREAGDPGHFFIPTFDEIEKRK